MPNSNSFLGKVLTIVVLFAVLMWVVKDPTAAATTANHAVTFVQTVLTGLLDFFTQVTLMTAATTAAGPVAVAGLEPAEIANAARIVAHAEAVADRYATAGVPVYDQVVVRLAGQVRALTHAWIDWCDPTPPAGHGRSVTDLAEILADLTLAGLAVLIRLHCDPLATLAARTGEQPASRAVTAVTAAGPARPGHGAALPNGDHR